MLNTIFIYIYIIYIYDIVCISLSIKKKKIGTYLHEVLSENNNRYFRRI